ncbi:MAG: shikimate kinase [Acidobacteriaceae bacterium]|nr:shikimate kinase [Acidobacteriaceae bacterium]
MTLKLKRTPGLYLVGFMAAGKTTIGRALADALGWPFKDLDAEIESQYARKIAQIFLEDGEGIFRELETAMIRMHVSAIEAGNPCVLALGGGAFVQRMNWDLIQNNGVAIWLDCTLETVRARLGDGATRPLAADPERLSKLYEDRRPLYARADFRIDVDTAEIDEIVRHILALPIF